MTTIAVALREGTVTMAADTLSLQNDQSTSIAHFADSKIIEVLGTFIGISGPSSAKLAVRHFFETNPDRACFGSVEEIFASWLNLHGALRSDYYLNELSNSVSSFESSEIDAIVVNATGAYVVSAYRSVNKILRYHAIGSGDQYALGAMHALYPHTDITPADLATAGIAAAAEFHIATALPATLVTMSLT